MKTTEFRLTNLRKDLPPDVYVWARWMIKSPLRGPPSRRPYALRLLSTSGREMARVWRTVEKMEKKHAGIALELFLFSVDAAAEASKIPNMPQGALNKLMKTIENDSRALANRIRDSIGAITYATGVQLDMRALIGRAIDYELANDEQFLREKFGRTSPLRIPKHMFFEPGSYASWISITSLLFAFASLCNTQNGQTPIRKKTGGKNYPANYCAVRIVKFIRSRTGSQNNALVASIVSAMFGVELSADMIRKLIPVETGQ